MSWIFIMGIALSVFFLLIFFLTRFIRYMKEEQNLEIETLKETLIDRDNPVGLSGVELEALKQQQAEAQRHLREVISKIPVTGKDGRFQIDHDKIRQDRELREKQANNGVSGSKEKDNA
jgi:hypothetical protein